jgi:hypothetical protein
MKKLLLLAELLPLAIGLFIKSGFAKRIFYYRIQSVL